MTFENVPTIFYLNEQNIFIIQNFIQFHIHIIFFCAHNSFKSKITSSRSVKPFGLNKIKLQ